MPSLTSLGLLLDIVGAVIVWRYGLPAPFDPLGRQAIYVSNLDPKAQAKGRRYRRFSHLGITLLVVGFVLQFLASLQ